jgi:hypothetical protein
MEECSFLKRWQRLIRGAGAEQRLALSEQ